MYPHERSLVKRLENQPFVLLGINSDQSREELKTVLRKEQITWRSWWDGPGTNGRIASRWRIEGWPSIFILDAKGVIRYKGHSATAMDKAVDKLLGEIGKSS